MMRSLFSAISGLRNHQLLMDNVGNNIANVNTTGFKGSRVTFEDVISQTLRQSTGPTAERGGQNPLQMGLGVQVGTIDTMITQGNLQATDKPTDLAIQGDGYFVLSDNAQTNPSYSYTRDGNLSLGVAPNGGTDRPLVQSATGLHVKGWIPPQAAGTADTTTAPTSDITIPATGQNGSAVTGFNVDSTGVISLTLADGTVQSGYAQIAIASFANPAGLNRAGGNLFTPSANSGAASYNGAATNGRGELKAGFLEMSNVDLAAQFTNMIIAQRGFQANSRVITASDEVLQDLVNIKH
ncbi:MAG TPA: flagellar hook-basal body complex protein [Chloroflexota bacterium]|nr:flagellar hook-basal body complex protein [Chloroflexota bacterium]